MIAFLLASLLPSLLLAMLAFSSASDSLQSEIERSLQVEAQAVSEDIDKMMFERLQNAQTWSRLEVMQEIQVNDVDKRLSKFLTGVKSGYRDVYTELLCIDTSGYVLASSNAASLGRKAAESEDRLSVPAVAESMRLGALRFTNNESKSVLPIDVDIDSMFKSGKIGRLQLLFNWEQIYGILDRAGRGSRQVILVDKTKRIIAASTVPRQHGLLMHMVPRNFLGSGKSGIATRDGGFLDEEELTIGFSRSRGFQNFPGNGWTTVVIQPSRQAFAPIRRMAAIFFLLLASTSTLAVGFSILIARRIARPITTLTEFTRGFLHGRQLAAVPRSSGGEVRELTDAFVKAVDELDQSRASLIRASKLAALGELSAAMAHEIRTPIGILRSSAQILAREPGLSEDGRELTSFIKSEADRLNGLVTTLLDSTRTRKPTLQPNNLNEIVHLSVGLLAPQAVLKNIVVTEALRAEATIVECDAEQMTQVLLNLIQNALQIVPNGGKVSVSVHDSGFQKMIEINDDGPGISADALPHVFEPFFSNREGGIGLGLSVVQQIISEHGGAIVAGRSAMGGAMFTISIPQRNTR